MKATDLVGTLNEAITGPGLPGRPHVNPHGGQEIPMMIKGEKPFAIISNAVLDESKTKKIFRLAAVHEWDIEEDDDHGSLLITLPGQSWRIGVYHEAMNMGQPEKSVIIGLLLGYPLENVMLFAREMAAMFIHGATPDEIESLIVEIGEMAKKLKASFDSRKDG